MISVRTFGSGSAGNAYWITDEPQGGGSALLLECGLPWDDIREASHYATWALDGVLVSHAHQDHARGVVDAVNSGVPCYMSGVAQSTVGVLGWRRVGLPDLRHAQKIGSWRVRAFPVEHDSPGTLGFAIAGPSGESLVYVGETPYCRQRFASPEIFMVEANYSDADLTRRQAAGEIDDAQAHRLRRAHMSLETALRLLAANDLSKTRQIILCHLSDRHADAEAFAAAVRRQTGKPVEVAPAWRSREVAR